MGDCAMLVFGAPDQDLQHRDHAIRCAVVIQKLIALVNLHRQRQGLRTLCFHIGVNSGQMLAGNIGSSERMNYTVIGDTVNLASRLASSAEAGQIIITQQLQDELSDAEYQPTVIFHDVLTLRGKQNPVNTYRVIDINGAREQSTQLFRQTLDIHAK
ncbi:Adenylate cyclase [hydrothermal vent metagenome]|uniref:Adenylate cyclase n=1 Tax=hydrothermal vent metagenome TaxID=652676 RepID=A0A3B0ZIW6_9ZZZZ